MTTFEGLITLKNLIVCSQKVAPARIFYAVEYRDILIRSRYF
jgi:hypothetical protein